METMVNKSTPVVCFVANFKYLYKHFPRIYQQLRVNGNYENQILIITTLLSPTFLIKYINKKNKIKILRFKKIKFDSLTETSLNNLNVSVNRHKTKNFQWHKVHLFDEKLTNWNYVFYIDINMSIHKSILPIIEKN